jgi:hypothetical protein
MKDTEYSSICTVQYYFSHLSITKSSKVGKTMCDLYFVPEAAASHLMH